MSYEKYPPATTCQGAPNFLSMVSLIICTRAACLEYTSDVSQTVQTDSKNAQFVSHNQTDLRALLHICMMLFHRGDACVHCFLAHFCGHVSMFHQGILSHLQKGFHIFDVFWFLRQGCHDCCERRCPYVVLQACSFYQGKRMLRSAGIRSSLRGKSQVCTIMNLNNVAKTGLSWCMWSCLRLLHGRLLACHGSVPSHISTQTNIYWHQKRIQVLSRTSIAASRTEASICKETSIHSVHCTAR